MTPARDQQFPIYTILKNKDALLYAFKSKKLKMECLRDSKRLQLENALLAWFKDVRTIRPLIPVSDNLLQVKAVDIASALGVKGFKASNGYIRGFKKRHQTE